MKIKYLLNSLIVIIFASLFNAATAFGDDYSGLTVYYDFNSENVSSNGDNYLIKDLSGNGYDAETMVTSLMEQFSLIESIYGEGQAGCGAIKIPNEAFTNIHSSYTINFLGQYMFLGSWQEKMLELGNSYYSAPWGSGINRLSTYYENNRKIVDFSERYPSYNDINMFTFVCNEGKLDMYFNGKKVGKYYEDGNSTIILSELAQNPENKFTVQNYYLDEFRLYNRALSDEEIKGLFNNETVVEINDASWADNQVTANITLNTFLISAYDCILAAYDEDSQLIATSTQRIISDVYNGELQMECGEKPTYLKLFIWNSFSGMKPQFNSFKYQM